MVLFGFAHKICTHTHSRRSKSNSRALKWNNNQRIKLNFPFCLDSHYSLFWIPSRTSVLLLLSMILLLVMFFLSETQLKWNSSTSIWTKNNCICRILISFRSTDYLNNKYRNVILSRFETKIKLILKPIFSTIICFAFSWFDMWTFIVGIYFSKNGSRSSYSCVLMHFKWFNWQLM